MTSRPREWSMLDDEDRGYLDGRRAGRASRATRNASRKIRRSRGG
ncbi:hypothetical protein [Rhodococcus qingshengii]|nr:hypothetical protein [Rhodococcus qingshengii]MCW0191171.1 hypothetical protein [Rhodococcus sp. (in: high G+C Gram-positive bacteria)]